MSASQEDLRTMQETLLRAVLLGEPLPGTSVGLAMPDLQFVTGGDSVRLLNENLHGPLSVPESPKPLQMVNRSDLSRGPEAASQGAYFRFAQSVVNENTVRITLEARMPPNASGTELGLSNVQIEFVRSGDRWIAGGTVFSAT